MQRYIRMQATALLTWNRPYNKMCCQYGVSAVYTKQHAGSERCIHTTHQTVWYLKEYLSLPLVSTNNNERAKGCQVLYFIKKNVNQKTRAVDNFSIQRKSDTIWKIQFECASRLKTMLLFFRLSSCFINQSHRFLTLIMVSSKIIWIRDETRKEQKQWTKQADPNALMLIGFNGQQQTQFESRVLCASVVVYVVHRQKCVVAQCQFWLCSKAECE